MPGPDPGQTGKRDRGRYNGLGKFRRSLITQYRNARTNKGKGLNMTYNATKASELVMYLMARKQAILNGHKAAERDHETAIARIVSGICGIRCNIDFDRSGNNKLLFYTTIYHEHQETFTSHTVTVKPGFRVNHICVSGKDLNRCKDRITAIFTAFLF